MADQDGESSGRKGSNCVRCRNHNLTVPLRGHKQYCPFAACTCDKCCFTAEQQRQMRLLSATRRSESNDSTRASRPGRRRKSSAVVSTTMVSPRQVQHSPVQQVVHSIDHQQPQQIIVTRVESFQPNMQTGGAPHEDRKALFDCSSELLKKFRYPWEMMPLMYALSKYANGNIGEVLQRIDEGQFAVNEQLRQQTLNMNFGNAARSSSMPASREC